MISKRSRHCKHFWRTSDRVSMFIFCLTTVYGIICWSTKSQMKGLATRGYKKFLVFDNRRRKTWLADFIKFCIASLRFDVTLQALIEFSRDFDPIIHFESNYFH